MTNINLPEDLLVEILSRVPTVSVARFRSTSKGWNSLIGDGRLSKKHFANAPRESLVLLLIEFRVYLMSVDLRGIHDNVAPYAKITGQFSLKDPISNSLEEIDIRNIFHCDGLLLCITTDNRLVVWNPCSRESRWIQLTKKYKETDCYALGKSSCNKYKILRQNFLIKASSQKRFEYEIYDFTSDSWKDICVTTDGFIVESLHPGMYVNGITYWLHPGRKFLLSFDFSTENFQNVSLPEKSGDTITFSYVTFSVTREGQQLCMLSAPIFENLKTNVWIATKSESTGALSWSKFLTVSRTVPGSDFPYRSQFCYGVSFLVDQENKVLLSCNKPSQFSNNIIHIVGENKYIEVDHHGAQPLNREPIPFLLGYVPSLVQIQHRI